MKTQELLEKIGKQGLAATTKDEMVRLACAYWHEDFLPDINHIMSFSTEEQRIMGYLTEFFASFHCVEESRIKKLVELANRIKSVLNPAITTNGPDEIAAEWGVTDNMDRFLDDILFYQTRHYVHNAKEQ